MRELIYTLLRGMTKNKRGLSRKVLHLAEAYTDAYNDFSYYASLNGEMTILHMLSHCGFREIFDVGANVGDWSRQASMFFPEATIHAFELSSNTFETLERNLPEARFRKNNFGLGDIDGAVQYKDYGDCSTLNTLLADATYHDPLIHPRILSAQTMRGDTYCATHGIEHIDFLKVDVEGAEHVVLQGFDHLLRNQQVRCVQFEYGYTNGDAKFLIKDFYEFFTARGYELGKIWRKGVEFRPFSYRMNDFKSGPNYLAVRASEPELVELLRYAP